VRCVVEQLRCPEYQDGGTDKLQECSVLGLFCIAPLLCARYVCSAGHILFQLYPKRVSCFSWR
jgi:hypothetical protein